MPGCSLAEVSELFDRGEELHQCVGHATRDQRPDGDALEEAHADDRADDECGDDVRIVLQQLDAAAARHGSENTTDDGGYAQGTLEGIDHVGDGHVACRNRHEDGSQKEYDAPVQPIDGKDVEHCRQSEKLQNEHDDDGIGDRRIVTDDAEGEDQEQHEVFGIHEEHLLCVDGENIAAEPADFLSYI